MSETVYYLGVKNGNGTQGTLVFPDQAKSFHAASGTSTLHSIPEGKYGVGQRQAAESEVALGKAKFKYRIIGVAKDGSASDQVHYDTLRKVNRTGLLIHPDGGKGPGSAGCIVVRGTHAITGNADPSAGSADVAAAQEVDGLLAGGDKNVVVKYFDSVEEMEKFHKQIAPGVDVPKKPTPEELAAKKKADEEKAAAAKAAKKKGKGKPSKTNRGAEVLKGQHNVFAGTQQLQVAYVTSPTTSGGPIAKGSPTVFLGQQQYAMARVEDPTMYGHQVETGEQSVLAG